MENVIFIGGTKVCLFHESHSISVLWNFEDISKGSGQSRHRGTTHVFIFCEDYNVLAHANWTYHMESKQLIRQFLEMFEISITKCRSLCAVKLFCSTEVN